MGAHEPLAGASCDVSALPSVDEWPLLPDHLTNVARLVKYGIIDAPEVRNALMCCPRSPHALPFPLADEVPHLEGSGLRLPWWADPNEPMSLLPGVFETSQVMQLLQIEKGASVLLLGPRGNWYTELLMHMGAGEILVVEASRHKQDALLARWNDLRLDIAAQAFGCTIRFCGPADIAQFTPEGGFDRLFSTGCFPSIPIHLVSCVCEDGFALLPVDNNGRGMLQMVQHHGEGELISQWIACWDVDTWSEEARISFETGEVEENVSEIVANGGKVIESAWIHANAVPSRDRFGPLQMLDTIEKIWDSMSPVHADLPDGVFSLGLRERIADDLFRMGHVLQQMGVHEFAAEHHGESFRLAPTAEAATFLGWALSDVDDAYGALAWCRKAIETDARLGNPWNDIGAILLGMEQPAAAIPWLAAATRSVRYDAIGHPWSNLARAHEILAHPHAAFEAAQQALELDPDDEVALRIIEDVGERLL